MAAALVAAALVLVAAAVVFAALAVTAELRRAREEAARGHVLAILTALAPGLEAARADARALLVWQPLARAVRHAFPAESAALDAAAGQRFPFSRQAIEEAHARWTADWLAWERAHDAEFKGRAAVAEQQVADAGGSAAARAVLESVEREKLDHYQRRYQEYVQVAKALQALVD